MKEEETFFCAVKVTDQELAETGLNALRGMERKMARQLAEEIIKYIRLERINDPDSMGSIYRTCVHVKFLGPKVTKYYEGIQDVTRTFRP